MDMRKTAKILGVVVAILLLVVAGLAAAVRFYLTDERIRSLVVPAAEKALARKIELGAISVGLFSGISLTDFAIKEMDGRTDFVKAEALVLRYEFWPLLKKQVIINKIQLDHPSVRIHRDKSGVFNFDSLPFVAARKKQPEIPQEATPAKGKAITVNEVAVSEAKVVVSDETGQIPALETLASADLNLMADANGAPAIAQGDADLAATFTIGRFKPRLILKASFDPARITYQAEAILDKDTVRLEGTMQDYRTTPQTTVNLAAKSLDLEKLLAMEAALPKKEEPEEISPLIKYNVRGKAKIDRLRYQRLLVNDLAADFDPRQVSLKADAEVEGERVAVNGLVANYLTAPRATLDLNAQRLTVEKLMGLAAKGPEDGGLAAPAAAKPLAEKLPKKFGAQGRITVDELRYKQLPLTKLVVPYRLQNGVFSINNLTARMAGGAVVANDTVDLRKLDPGIKGDLAVRAIQVSEFLKGVAPAAANLVGGTAEGTCTYAGAGLGWAKLQHNILADGTFSVQGARLHNAPLTAAVALLLNMPELTDLSLTNANGTVHVANRVVALDTKMTGQDLNIVATGTIDFDKNLNLPVAMRFSPRLSSKLQQQASIARYLTSDAGETMIRLRIGGTLSKPRPEPDPTMLREGAERAIKKKLLEKLAPPQNGQPTDPNQPQPQQPSSPAQQLLRDLLGM